MAIDVYLQIDGIKGESSDSTHAGWIEVSQAQWGVAQPFGTRDSATGGRTTGRSEYRTLSLAKFADLASPLLMQHCSNGKTTPKAKLEFMRVDGDGKRVRHYEVELENVLVGSMEKMVGKGSILRDHVSLHFAKVEWKYCSRRSAAAWAGILPAAGTWAATSRAHDGWHHGQSIG